MRTSLLVIALIQSMWLGSKRYERDDFINHPVSPGCRPQTAPRAGHVEADSPPAAHTA